MSLYARLGLPAALVALIVLFSVATPTFLTAANLSSLALNHFAILSFAALAMTLVVSAGGIDLSVGTAIDMAALAYIVILAQGGAPALALAGAFAGAALVGGFNAVLIGGLGLPPFLATLGTLFIGQSVQQLATNGGVPIYLIAGAPRPVFALVDAARLWLAVAAAVGVALLLATSVFGRRIVAAGVGPAVAYYSGAPVRRDIGVVMIVSALIAGVAGVVLSSSVRSYAPLSGNAYLMDAIGATFLGTTVSAWGRANVPGTLLGVLLLSVIKNGLLLLGVNFYWQQVASGSAIFIVLAVSFARRRQE
jgi:ribose transport system permease protein